MGQRKYPPLEPREIIQILEARGFVFIKQQGDHRFYSRKVRGQPMIPQVDMGADVYDVYLVKKVIAQSGLTRKQFYGSTKGTAKKINAKLATPKELETWAS